MYRLKKEKIGTETGRENKSPLFGETEFPENYEENAHVQQNMNETYAKKLVADICIKFPDRSSPLSLLEIGCGGGTSTQLVYNLLKEKRYENITLEGLDISHAQINTAREKLDSSMKEITFRQKDASQLQQKNKYDCVFSFFTFHWIEDKSNLSRCVANALKDNGYLFYLTVTPLKHWLSIRKENLKQLVENSEWRAIFKDFKEEDFLPFAAHSKYEAAFSNDFKIVFFKEKNKRLNHFDSEFRKFITSWLPEIRYLKSKMKDDPKELQSRIDSFLENLISLIPAQSSEETEVNKKQDNIHFDQLFSVFSGSKKGQGKENSGEENKGQLNEGANVDNPINFSNN